MLTTTSSTFTPSLPADCPPSIRLPGKRTSPAGRHFSSLRLAIACWANSIVRLLPDPREPGACGPRTGRGADDPVPDERRLADAIPHRRTSRQAFSNDPVRMHVIDALVTAADLEERA